MQMIVVPIINLCDILKYGVMELMFDLSNPYLDMKMLLNDLHIKATFEFRD